MDTKNFPTLNDIPEYAAAVAKHGELQKKRQALADVIERSRAALRKRGDAGRPALNAAAAAVIEGRPLPDKGALRTDLDTADYELAVIEQALLVQTKHMAAAKDRAAATIAERMKPAHKAVARKMRDALAALVAAMKEEREFSNEAQAREVHNAFPQLHFCVLGAIPVEVMQAAKGWLAEQADYCR